MTTRPISMHMLCECINETQKLSDRINLKDWEASGFLEN